MYIRGVDNKSLAKDMRAAVLAQLNAEIKAAGKTPKSLAQEMELNYGSFRRYLNGEQPLHASMLWDILAHLEIKGSDFTIAAEERLARD